MSRENTTKRDFTFDFVGEKKYIETLFLSLVTVLPHSTMNDKCEFRKKIQVKIENILQKISQKLF